MGVRGCCYGCGAALQTEVPPGPGYVAPDKYAVKKQRRQLGKVLCLRCSDLSNGAMIPAVQDFTQKLSVRQSAAAGARAAFAAARALAPARSAEAPAGAAATELPPGSWLETRPRVLPGVAPCRSELHVLVTPEQLRARLTPLALRSAVVLLLVDLLDASGTLMARVRDMVGRNPIVLGCRPRELADWLSSAAAAKKLNLVSLHLVSSHTGEGMSAVVSRMCRERKSRDVYVVGAANVGKSAFVRAVLKELARTEPAAIGTGKYLPVESAMPGTTLGLIPLSAFSEGGVLYDTPGVHLHHRIPHMLSPPELKLFHPRRRLTAVVPTLPLEFLEEASEEREPEPEPAAARAGATAPPADGGEGPARSGRNGLKMVEHAPRDQYGVPMSGLEAGFGPRARRAGSNAAPPPGTAASNAAAPLRATAEVRPGQAAAAAVRATYMWSDLVRVDVLAGPPSTALVFYGPASMRVVGLPYIPAEQKLLVDYQGDEEGGGGGGGRSRVLVCTESVALRGGLQAHELVVRSSGAGGGCAVADIAVSGLSGWVAVWAPGAKQDVRLRVWAPRGVEVMLRSPLPCPPPLALQRSWRRSSGESAEEGAAGGEEITPAALDEWSRALSLGSRDPTTDPEWWESMAALKDADLYGMAGPRGRGRSAGPGGAPTGATAGGSEGEDGEDDDEEDEEEGEGGEAVVMSARVEDILRRP
ncbi:putative nitric oxide synthase, partial [Tetrabaena socialis]